MVPQRRREVYALPVYSHLLPNACDPAWEKWSAPLLVFLHSPRNWPKLFAWAKEHHVSRWTVRQLVAYLSFTDRVDWDDTKRSWQAIGKSR